MPMSPQRFIKLQNDFMKIFNDAKGQVANPWYGVKPEGCSEQAKAISRLAGLEEIRRDSIAKGYAEAAAYPTLKQADVKEMQKALRVIMHATEPDPARKGSDFGIPYADAVEAEMALTRLDYKLNL